MGVHERILSRMSNCESFKVHDRLYVFASITERRCSDSELTGIDLSIFLTPRLVSGQHQSYLSKIVKIHFYVWPCGAAVLFLCFVEF